VLRIRSTIKDFRSTGTRVKHKKAGLDFTASPAFKQHIVRNDHGRLARGFEHGGDNLDKRRKPFGSELIRCLWQAIHNESTS
jgi:hypothetical protein